VRQFNSKKALEFITDEVKGRSMSLYSNYALAIMGILIIKGLSIISKQIVELYTKDKN